MLIPSPTKKLAQTVLQTPLHHKYDANYLTDNLQSGRTPDLRLALNEFRVAKTSTPKAQLCM